MRELLEGYRITDHGREVMGRVGVSSLMFISGDIMARCARS